MPKEWCKGPVQVSRGLRRTDVVLFQTTILPKEFSSSARLYIHIWVCQFFGGFNL